MSELPRYGSTHHAEYCSADSTGHVCVVRASLPSVRRRGDDAVSTYICRSFERMIETTQTHTRSKKLAINTTPHMHLKESRHLKHRWSDCRQDITFCLYVWNIRYCIHFSTRKGKRSHDASPRICLVDCSMNTDFKRNSSSGIPDIEK